MSSFLFSERLVRKIRLAIPCAHYKSPRQRRAKFPLPVQHIKPMAHLNCHSVCAEQFLQVAILPVPGRHLTQIRLSSIPPLHDYLLNV